MRDFLSELSVAALESGPGVAHEEFTDWERRHGRLLPEELKRFYGRFNGGSFHGGVEVFALEELASEVSDGLVVLGRRGRGLELLMLSKSDLAEALGASLPGWLEALPEETWVFALREGDAPLRPARTFEGVMDRVLPPRETEAFGDNTFAQGIHAVQEALLSLPQDELDGIASDGIQVIRARPARARASSKVVSTRRPARQPATKPKAPAKVKVQAKAKRAKSKGAKKAPRRTPLKKAAKKPTVAKRGAPRKAKAPSRRK